MVGVHCSGESHLRMHPHEIEHISLSFGGVPQTTLLMRCNSPSNPEAQRPPISYVWMSVDWNWLQYGCQRLTSRCESTLIATVRSFPNWRQCGTRLHLGSKNFNKLLHVAYTIQNSRQREEGIFVTTAPEPVTLIFSFLNTCTYEWVCEKSENNIRVNVIWESEI